MKKLVYNTRDYSVNIIGDQLHHGNDFFVHSNCSYDELEILIILDSRGISKSYETSLAKMFVDYFNQKKYLLMVRPLELTTWTTLYNFLCVNKINPITIITNVGIVDFTPKKRSICDSLIEQIHYSYDKNISLKPLENYLLSNGNKETLYTIEYPKSYIHQMNQKFNSESIYAIKTPLVDSEIKIERKRPLSFFKQLEMANKLIDVIECNAIDVGLFDIEYTYDAIHWTENGNRYIFEQVINNINT